MPETQTSTPTTKKPNWLKQRTALEVCLLIIGSGLAAAAITLALLLRPAHAPMEPAWGNVAEWAGVVVTFFGFVGAFGALMLQRKSVSIQVDQHLADIAATNAAARAELEAGREAELKAAKEAKLKHERYASEFVLKLTAKHRDKLRGQEHPSDGELALSVRATAGSAFSHSAVKLHVPSLPDLYVPVDQFSEFDSLPTGRGNPSMSWQATKPSDATPIFTGADRDAEALSWLQEHTWIEFTDPAKTRWRKDGRGKFEELPKIPHADS